MAKQIAKTTKNIGTISKAGVKSTRKSVNWEFPLSKQNFIIGAIGIGVILLGYLLMATGITNEPAVPDGKWNNPLAVVVAPIVLVIGYCAIIPFALLKQDKKIENSEENN